MKAAKWLKQMLVLTMLFTSFSGGAAYAEEGPETVTPSNFSRTPAFPGAEGGGKYTSGGRGGDVYEVTTLADSGPGSLRDAVSAGNRTVVFKVGGIIELKSPLKILGDNLTIAGQTAPGDGITVIGYPTSFDGNNLIIRYMRFRLGDMNETETDSFGGRYKKDIIIDHSSFSWSVDEVLSPYGNENVTVQWSIIADAMHISKHVKGRHGYGGIWGGKNTSFHHNLIAHNSSRNPAFDSTAGNSHDFRNNVVYNWGFFASYGGKGAVTNMINNYYKPGPETEVVRFMNAESTGSYYIDGNVMDGYPEYTQDNWSGVHKYPNYVKLETPASFANPLPTESAEEAYAAVMQSAGATLPKRDAVDARIIHDVIHRTGMHINSQNEVGGYPLEEPVRSSLEDDDHDGMPNDWEIARGLDPIDPSDRNLANEEGYTKLELYLNSITGNGSANPSAVITAPANNTVVKAGANVTIEASVFDEDGSVSKVEFYRNGEKVGEDDSMPFRYEWTDAADGTHYWAAKAIDDTGTMAFSTGVIVHANTEGSIDPWRSADIGSPGIPGHTQLGKGPGAVTVKAAGDIGGTKDVFHFAYQEIEGDAEIVARVESITPTNEEAEAGIMFRESLKEDAPFVSLVVPYIRTGKRGVTLSRAEEGGEVARIQPEQQFQLPYWIKLVRKDNQFTSMISQDGTSWTTVGNVQVDLPKLAHVGLVADAAKVNNETWKYNTATFSNVNLSADTGSGPKTVYYVNDDFENLEAGSVPDGYGVIPQPQDADHTVTVEQVPANSTGNGSEKALKVYDNAVGSTGFTLNFPQQLGTVVVETDFMSPAMPGTSVLLQIKDAGGTKTPIALEVRKPQLPVQEDAYALVYKNKNGQDVKLTGLPAANRWYNLKVIANAAANTMDIYVDNVLAAERVEFRDDMRTLGLGSALFGRTPGTGKGTYYFDNIKVYVEPAAAPKGLRAIPGNGKVQLDWSSAQGALSYTVKRSTTNGGPYETVATDWSASTPSFTDTSVINETTYYYVVTAVSEFGESDPSNQVRVTPSVNAVKPQAPMELAGLGRHTQADLTWQPVEHAVTYTVKRSESQEGPYIEAGRVEEPFYRDTGLVNGKVYYYAVTATSVAGESDASDPVEVRPVAPLESPAGVKASAGDASAVISWNASPEASSYQIKRSTVHGGPYTVIADQVKDVRYEDSGLENGRAYYYVVSAHNRAASSANSEAVRVIPFPANTAPPPGDLRLNPAKDRVKLSWSAVGGAASYQITRSEARNEEGKVIASDLRQPGFIDTDVVTGKTYYYSVRSVNGNGPGVGSDPQGATPASVIVVAKDGTGMFTSVQAAVDSIPDGNTDRTIIYIRNGIYEEQVTVPKTKHAVSFIGESKERTVITYTGITGTGFNERATAVESDDFTAENITFANGAGPQGPAPALDLRGDRAFFNHVRMIGYQDTFFVNNAGKRVYVKNSYIEGAVDFIYGPGIAVFDQSVIHNVRSGGYITAASTPENQPYGYLFLNSKIIGTEGIEDVYLGRPWRPFAHVLFMNTEMEGIVHDKGWHNWGRPDNEKTAKYYEYNNTGPGAAAEARANWSKQLTPEEANLYTVPMMMKGSDGWNPTMMPVLPEPYAEEDDTPPHTTSKLTPEQPNGLNGWYTVPVTVELSAQDDGSTVTETVYSLDGVTWTHYSGPIVLDRVAASAAIYYRSVNAAGIEESIQSVPLAIDLSPPDIRVEPLAQEGGWNVSSDWTPVIHMSDSVSGVDDSRTVIKLDGQPVPPGEAIPLYQIPLGSHVLTVEGADLAGNTAAAEIEFQTFTSTGDMIALIERFLSSGEIGNAGIVNSLTKKLEKGNLGSFENEVRAQRGKHLSELAADVLLRHAEALRKDII
ncbi:pectinesterase family protein [Paenibacillus sp. MDMC362]|uniref:pectinesterase family protein n=1 Tax=Paenibacillus sp. MDMC362 TaxID=2977365 RepID=UPI0015EC3500|nr:pectinesterase family protein [Paenibacillus sp. MDMC362]